MRISRFQLWSFVVALLLSSSAPCFAQVQTGTPPFASYGGGPDIINLGNLNAHLTVPIVQKAGRGTNFTYYLNLDSSVWYPSDSSGTLSWQPNIFPGQFGSSAGYVGLIEVQIQFGLMTRHTAGPRPIRQDCGRFGLKIRKAGTGMLMYRIRRCHLLIRWV